MNLKSEDILFVGRGTGVVPWYRTGMPSFHLGCDWAGIVGAPPHLEVVSSLKRGGHGQPSLYDYKIVILQQVSGRMWLSEIRKLQEAGIKVIYDVDDYLHGVRKVKGHRSKAAYGTKQLADYELCMRVCDAMIVSTPWLAKAYAKFNENIYVCRNFIDFDRYDRFKIPERPTLNIGWAGGEGHLESARRWLPAVQRILDEFEHTRFISMGLPIAGLLKMPTRAVSLPFISIENFPPALTSFDIAIAPAGRGHFFAAKSDLRYLETGALGIPLVADPFVYGEVVHERTGLLAEGVGDAETALRRLVSDAEMRRSIGGAAQDYVSAHRSVEPGITQWEKVFVAAWDS